MHDAIESVFSFSVQFLQIKVSTNRGFDVQNLHGIDKGWLQSCTDQIAAGYEALAFAIAPGVAKSLASRLFCGPLT